jgi:hypothetical protein
MQSFGHEIGQHHHRERLEAFWMRFWMLCFTLHVGKRGVSVHVIDKFMRVYAQHHALLFLNSGIPCTSEKDSCLATPDF